MGTREKSVKVPLIVLTTKTSNTITFLLFIGDESRQEAGIALTVALFACLHFQGGPQQILLEEVKLEVFKTLNYFSPSYLWDLFNVKQVEYTFFL